MILIGMIGSLCFLLFGLVIKNYPAKYGSNTGINTRRARKTQENWDFAQGYGARCIIINGARSIVLNVLLLGGVYWKQNLSGKILILEGIACFFFLVLSLVQIEYATKQFEKTGNPK